jgi:mannose-6-phosphate isomerase
MSVVDLTKVGERKEAFYKVQEYIDSLNFTIASHDYTRPWGGFLVIDEAEASRFASHFFPEVKFDDLKISGKLSPKILLVAPDQRLSWQYHHRRAEIWKLVAGEAGIITSDTDAEGDLRNLKIGEIIRLKQGERHRLIGLDGWGMVAEIWQHTDAAQPSDENDIVRVQDDFGR